jgi:hypothetical protein
MGGGIMSPEAQQIAMKKIAFNVTPAQFDAFEKFRKADTITSEPRAPFARRLFLLGLVQSMTNNQVNVAFNESHKQ